MFEKLYILEGIENTSVARAFLKYFEKRNLPVVFVQDEQELPPLGHPKRNLFLTRRKGGFVNPCPCSPGVVCCGYQNINLIEGCPFFCNYCALDVYLNFLATKVFVNLEDFEAELEDYLSRRKKVRIGTGELTDSLVWEEIFPYSDYLMDLFRKYPQVILEFKTKSKNIESFLTRPVQQNTVISWSLNAPRKIAEEESGVASLEERLEAARQVAKHGWWVGFHFDPIYYYSGWEKDYGEVLSWLAERFAPESIAWVSLGVIRFAPSLKPVLHDRNTRIHEMELFPSFYDGKLRLFFPLRKKVFDFFLSHLKPYGQKVYLCMEPSFMWEETRRDFQDINSVLWKGVMERFFR